MAEKRLPVYVSLDEAAEVMSLSVKTIRRRIADGTIPAYQCGRRPIRIRLDDLESALRHPLGPVVSAMSSHGASEQAGDVVFAGADSRCAIQHLCRLGRSPAGRQPCRVIARAVTATARSAPSTRRPPVRAAPARYPSRS